MLDQLYMDRISSIAAYIHIVTDVSSEMIVISRKYEYESNLKHQLYPKVIKQFSCKHLFLYTCIRR